jgi:hypothetical protein
VSLFAYSNSWYSPSFSVYAEAVPKRILELMNVEKLTWENIASHQKARHFIYFLVVISRSVPCPSHTAKCKSLYCSQQLGIKDSRAYNKLYPRDSSDIFGTRHCIPCKFSVCKWYRILPYIMLTN